MITLLQAKLLSRWRAGMVSEPFKTHGGDHTTKASLRAEGAITPASMWRQRITPKGLDMLSEYEREWGTVPAT